MDLATYFERSAPFCIHYPDRRLDAYAHGLMAEVGEVLEAIAWAADRVLSRDLLHELGDVAWNLVQAARAVGLTPELLEPDRGVLPAVASDLSCERVFVSSCARLSGVLEKSHRRGANGRELEEARAVLPQAWKALLTLAYRNGFSMRQVMDTNIEKLSARYAKEER